MAAQWALGAVIGVLCAGVVFARLQARPPHARPTQRQTALLLGVTVAVTTGLIGLSSGRSGPAQTVLAWCAALFFVAVAVLALTLQLGLREWLWVRLSRRHPQRADAVLRMRQGRDHRGWGLVPPLVMTWFAGRAFQQHAPWAWVYVSAAALFAVVAALRLRDAVPPRRTTE